MNDLTIAEFDKEPNWLRISDLYASLHATTKSLHSDIGNYNDALNQLDGLGIRIINGRERLAMLRDQIAALEEMP